MTLISIEPFSPANERAVVVCVPEGAQPPVCALAYDPEDGQTQAYALVCALACSAGDHADDRHRQADTPNPGKDHNNCCKRT